MLRHLLASLLLAAFALSWSPAGSAQAVDPRQQGDIAQGEQCLRQMERDPRGAMALAGNMLARDGAGDGARMMALACLVRAQIRIGEGAQAQARVPELLRLLDAADLPPQLHVEMRLFTATALQELGQVGVAGEVLEAALAESEPYTNLHVQALVAIALHHARGMRDPASAEPYFRRAIETTTRRPGGQLPIDAIPYFNYGLAVLELGRIDDAAGLLETAAALAGRDRHLDRLRGRIESTLGRLALERGDLVAARRKLEVAETLQRAMEDTPGLAATLRQLAELGLLEGSPRQALEHGSESAALAGDGQLADQIHESLELMARIHAALGNPAESRSWSERARRYLAEAGRERDPAIGAALARHAPRPAESIERLGSLTRARVIGTLALLALVATLLASGWMLLQARRHHRHLARSSTTDALTGLANRRAATRRLEALQADGGGGVRTALLLVDIDRFKAINDQHGHEVGDRVLVAVGRCLRDASDANDIVARWGGEEFLVLRPHTSRAAANALAEHLRATIEGLAIPLPDGQSTSVTASIGVAPCPYFPGLDGWHGAIRMADRALYAAKHSGRNAWAGTWGQQAGRQVDIDEVRADPEAAAAAGWVSVSGSRPITWSLPQGGEHPRRAAGRRNEPGLQAGDAG